MQTRTINVVCVAIALVACTSCIRSDQSAAWSTIAESVESPVTQLEITPESDSSDFRKRVLNRLELETAAFEGSKLLLVFHRGISCVQCVSQLSALGRRLDEFESQEIKIIGICPNMPPPEVMDKFKSTIHIHFPIVANTDLELFREFNCVAKEDRLLHGLFLISPDGQILWQDIAEHAVIDIDEILRCCTSTQLKDGIR